MSIVLRRNPREMVPDLIDWFEEPFLTLRPYLGQAIRIEDYIEDGQYVVRAEMAGVDPEKDLEVCVGAGYVVLRAARSASIEGKHRSEFRYGTFSRTIELPPGADADSATADYSAGILTIKVAVKGERQEAVKAIPVTVTKK
jgi:HSP20 family molecular chaperone IbpA